MYKLLSKINLILKFFRFILGCLLNTEVAQRPDINQVLYHLENISQTRGVKLDEKSLKFLKKTELLLHSTAPSISNAGGGVGGGNSNQPAPASHSQAAGGGGHGAHGGNWMGSAAGLFKGNSLFKTIKDASSKVMDSVQQ